MWLKNQLREAKSSSLDIPELLQLLLFKPSSSCRHVNTANMNNSHSSYSPCFFFPLEAEAEWTSRAGRDRKAETCEAMQKQQHFYSRVEGRAAAWWCFPLGRWPPPWAGRVSAPSQSRTWTWACCPGPTGAALGRNCCWGLGTQNHFAPDRYWLWPVFWGWYFHSVAFGAERNV